MAKRRPLTTQPSEAPRRETTSNKRPEKKPAQAPIDSVAVVIGTQLGKAAKRTRALRAGLSAVRETIAETSGRAAETLKNLMPGTRSAKKVGSRKAQSAKAKRPTSTPAHGDDALTHRAVPATKRSTTRVAVAAPRRRADAARRG